MSDNISSGRRGGLLIGNIAVIVVALDGPGCWSNQRWNR